MNKIAIKNIFWGLIIGFCIIAVIYVLFFTYYQFAVWFHHDRSDATTCQKIADSIKAKKIAGTYDYCNLGIPYWKRIFMERYKNQLLSNFGYYIDLISDEPFYLEPE